ncbi:UDP-2,3-diacylglucosamine diphosphatase [Shewanella avicenniae]|uniref:UDP-2,3-diacylglucosamine hydrolase n=1 Tax=Shewanella avicenniae TaxID=2814294 RepID=A0ABX7QTS5_9GAMM|nr:UDP-2,3-diacylglucosamine diphosphatase [Shewanella avicenniae]QSX34892.1 UDP-2,3-diacylglucosamine diphosphatase [Shewanella avicenniae]
MQTLFIGDLHLSADRPDITLAFSQFLDNLAQVDALYILGDLFEVWVGDDLAEPFALAIAEKLRRISQQIPIYFTHGNRDFLLGKRYAKQAGMTLLPEVFTTEIYQQRCVILHGDSLCTLDHDYQKFRRFRNNPLVRLGFKCLTKTKRLKIAAKLRADSKQQNQIKSYEIMDVAPAAVLELMLQQRADLMIHGHTHRPAIHHLAEKQTRAVVGDWYEQGSVLKLTPAGLELQTLPFSN